MNKPNKQTVKVRNKNQRGGEVKKVVERYVELKEVEKILQLSRYRLRTLCSNGYFKTSRKNVFERWTVLLSEVEEKKEEREEKKKKVTTTSNKYYVKPSTRSVRMIRKCLVVDSVLTQTEKELVDKFLNRCEILFSNK